MTHRNSTSRRFTPALLATAISITCLSTATAQGMNTRIIGGSTALQGSYPWMVSLKSGNSHFCGASLVAPRWVLTAAHCVEEETATGLTAVIGEYDQSRTDSGEQSRSVRRIVIHPKRQSSSDDYDVALLELDKPVTGKTVGLASPELFSSISAGSPLTVMGWGNLSTTGQEFPNILNEVQVPLVSSADCKAAYGDSSISDNMICAGLPQGGKDSCQGDSGGPLVYQRDQQWVQLGIVSWGDGCAQAGSPGVYAKVSSLKQWIDSVQTADGSAPPAPEQPEQPAPETPDSDDGAEQAFGLPWWIELLSVDGEVVSETIHFTNNTTQAVGIASASIANAGFSVDSSPCSDNLASGESCELSVSFDPANVAAAPTQTGGETLGETVATLELLTSDGQTLSIELYGLDLVALDGNDEQDTDDAPDWYAEDDTWQPDDDGFSLDCGLLYEDEEARLETTLQGPGYLQFDFWLDEDADNNQLSYFVDGEAVRTVRGGARSTPASHRTELSAGTHRITWIYRKNAASSGTARVSNIKVVRSNADDGTASNTGNTTDTPTSQSGGGASGPLLMLGLLPLLGMRRLWHRIKR